MTRKIKNNGRRCCTSINDKRGNKILDRGEVIKRWEEHFKEVLNREDSAEVLNIEDIGEAMEVMEIATNAMTLEEIKTALRSIKLGKEAGLDGIKEELLRERIEISASILERTFKKIWEN